jgi:hypothetical protein
VGRGSAAGLLAAALALGPLEAQGAGTQGVVHRVTSAQESYAEIAQHYYGARALGHHLRVLNRVPEPLSPGRTLIIPTCREVPLKKGQTLEAFAKTHLGDASRAEYLELLHFLKSKTPKPGKALKVPTSLRHVVRPGESVASLARLYYQDGSPRRQRLLVLYNLLPRSDVAVGETLRIPLDTEPFEHEAVLRRSKLPLGSAAPEAVAEAPQPRAARPAAAEPGPIPRAEAQRQVEISERLYGEGRYAQCLEHAKQVLERDDTRLPAGPKVELLRLAASALVALDRIAEAEATFTLLRRVDPAYELDLYRTSPKILDVFESTRP